MAGSNTCCEVQVETEPVVQTRNSRAGLLKLSAGVVGLGAWWFLYRQLAGISGVR